MTRLRDSAPGDYYEWVLATEIEQIKEKVFEIYKNLVTEENQTVTDQSLTEPQIT